MRDAVIVDAVRAPIGRRKGTLKGVHPVDLSASVLTALASRNQLDPELIEDIVWGCVTQIADQSTNVGRLAVLAAGWPETIPGVTLDRACGSSQQAVHFAAASVVAGHYDIVVAGGVESMSRVPLGAARAMGEPFGPRVRERYQRDTFSQGLGAEDIARRWGLSRTQLDEFALESHRKAAAATDAGAFAGQLVPVSGPDGELTADEGIRRETSLEKLAALKPVFDPTGTVTAGNASPLNDGAAALVLMAADEARKAGKKVRAYFRAFAVAGVPPAIMGIGPVPAVRKLLAKTGLTIDQIDLYEVNEAFASQALYCLRELGLPQDRVNVNGGAIALGHPLGCTGARQIATALHELERRKGRYAVITMCVGGGMGAAGLIERAA